MQILYQKNLFHCKDWINSINILANRFVLICDDIVAEIWGRKLYRYLISFGMQIDLITFDAGEKNKNRKTKELLEDQLFHLKIQKDACLIAMGGGVTTDLVGFLASTYLRGINAIFIPTTLLGMVDACIGGKTGVNTSFGKNLIGTFFLPKKVIIDSELLHTLNEEHVIDGLVEMLKHGLIADRKHFFSVKKHFLKRSLPFLELIKESQLLKQKIIEKDAKDQNLRKTLNFGHTFGHAYELLTQYEISHGKAVALGILMESYLSKEKNLLSMEDFEEVRTLFSPLLPMKDFSIEGWKEALRYDKKNFQETIQCVLIKEIGKAHFSPPHFTFGVSYEELSSALQWIYNLALC